MKIFEKIYPTIGCCGLDCGLCPRYYTVGASRCPGCAGTDFASKHPSCSFITCCVKKKNFETCGQCQDFPCPKFKTNEFYQQLKESPSYPSYKKVFQNLNFIKENGIEKFIKEQKKRIEILQIIIDKFNDGRSKSFFYKVSCLLDIKDLKKAIFSAYNHLKPGGVLLIVAHTKEEFRQNNFLYTGSSKDTEITVFENNYIVGPAKTTYEATMIYLIRKNGKLKIYSDIHIIGLFKLQVWLDIFEEFGFEVKQFKMENSYDRFILGEGRYPLTVFACIKPIKQ